MSIDKCNIICYNRDKKGESQWKIKKNKVSMTEQNTAVLYAADIYEIFFLCQLFELKQHPRR